MSAVICASSTLSSSALNLLRAASYFSAAASHFGWYSFALAPLVVLEVLGRDVLAAVVAESSPPE
jgi:hypothetical protein